MVGAAAHRAHAQTGRHGIANPPPAHCRIAVANPAAADLPDLCKRAGRQVATEQRVLALGFRPLSETVDWRLISIKTTASPAKSSAISY